MRIIDAFWEKRNLGVNCMEIIIEDDDSIECLVENIDLIDNTEYLVLKVPCRRFDFYKFIVKYNFTFVEATINLKIDLKDSVLSPLQQRINNSICYSEMGNQDLSDLFDEIKCGIFTTDRIVLDNHFTKEQAAVRYINWIKDELEKKAQVYKLSYRENAIGFFTFTQRDEGLYYPFLGGLYKNFSNSGLGFATIRKPIEEAINRNGTTISTYVSSNNSAVIRAHIQQGFNINNINYIFVRHN